MGNRVYAGRSARTRREPIVYACGCGERFRAEVYRAVDSADGQAVAKMNEGRLNVLRCPSCEAPSEVQVSVIFHDTQAPRLVLVLPDGLRHRELEERAAFFQTLAADHEPPPLYVLEAPVVFGAAGLRAILAPPPSEDSFSGQLPTPTPVPTPVPVSDRETTKPRIVEAQLRRPARATPVPNKATPVPNVATPVDGDDGHTRVRMQVPDPRSAMIERWIAGREGPSAFLVDEQVLVCAALPPPALEHFLSADAGKVELRVQLHRMPSYPVLAITVVAPPRGDARKSDEHRVLSVPLDVARAAHRVVLDALARKCAVTVELYDAQYLPVVSQRVTAPLEENVRRLAQEARDALERLSPQSRNFDRARGQIFTPSYDRLGRTPVDLPDDTTSLENLEKPGAVLQALAAVARWSEASAEAYLVEIRSIPLTRWRAVRARVIHRALDVGIAVSRPLVERSAKEYSSPLPSWQELLSIQVRRFAEVSARAAPNDLSAAEEAENWDLLLRECALAGVVVDDQIRQLAAQAVRRARAGSGAGVDLRSLDTGELVALLERKELRREAAIILCERRESQTLPALFAALKRMARGEANVVLPAATGFGPAAEKWLIEGLNSKKAFMRQGCALALGTLKTALAVDALVKQLLLEPTEIWTEVARGLGDAGAQSVMPLAAQLRSVDAEQRDRIINALAQVAARGTRGPIEMLASGRDALVGAAAQRALVLAAEVRNADEAVRRGQTPYSEQTVVRGFSRRFYEALEGGSGAIELDPADLQELAAAGNGDDESLGEDEEFERVSTATDLPVLQTVQSRMPRPNEDNTSPVPKSTLPGEGR